MALKQESYMNSKNSSRYMENVFIEKKKIGNDLSNLLQDYHCQSWKINCKISSIKVKEGEILISSEFFFFKKGTSDFAFYIIT